MLISIPIIDGNSGKGSPVFSRSAKNKNSEFNAFLKPLPERNMSEN